MALISIIDDFRPRQDERLLRRAAELTPRLLREDRGPAAVLPLPEGGALPPEALPTLRLGRDEGVCLDFGTHLVGRVTLDLTFEGSHPDAPVYLRLTFAEVPAELREDPRAYDGWLSKSWIQEESVHLDELPGLLSLPRRYAFRYLRIAVVDTSPKFRLVIRGARCRTETSADRAAAALRSYGDPRLDEIAAVSRRTLANCMQEVFEDGPKRDRRLWLGDLRLQALTNYVSFRNNDLVKRCLYLFAGSRFPDGRISACLFTAPVPAADDTFLLDYALLYPAAVEEYLRQTSDREALDDLYDAAMAQVDYALAQCGADGILRPAAVGDCFIDWCDELDRTASAQGVLLCALGYAIALAERKGDRPRRETLARRREALRAAAMAAFWNEERGCFLSGGQASAASQVWMVLGDVPSPAQARRAMTAARTSAEAPMTTPYIHHYFVMALMRAGLRDEAEAHLRAYWGGMLDAGADTFWECWDPERPELSPYGGLLVNSYCHAWSCTPAYIIDRLLRPAPGSPADDRWR